MVVLVMMTRDLRWCASLDYTGLFESQMGGHLHLIRVQSLYAKKFSVLELDNDTLRWSVKYRIHLARLISAFPEMVQQTSSGTQYAFSILSVIRGETEEDPTLLLTIPGKLVPYNLVFKTAKVRESLRFNHISAYPYTESFAPGEDWIFDPNWRSISGYGYLVVLSCEDFFKDYSLCLSSLSFL